MGHRIRRLLPVLMLLLTLMIALPVLAQDDLTETFTFDSGAAFQYPEAWLLDEGNDPVKIASEQTEMLFVDYAGLQAIGVDANEAAPDAILEMYFTEYHPARSFKAIKIEPFEVGDRSGVQYDYSADDGRARVMVIPFSNGSAGVVEAVSLAGKLREEDTILAIVESFDNSDEVTGTTAVVERVVNCTISTNRDDTVQVRVGPGENRSSIVFLSAGPSFKVLGKAEASDGSLWWKLDKEQVAPDKAVNEVWVKQDDVAPKGNCEDVVDVNAPPIVPIVNSAPPANTNSGSDNPPPAGSVPQAGAWFIVYSSGKGSCFGTDTIDIAVDLPPQAISVSVNGSTINLDGDILSRISGNTYQGIGQIVEEGQVYSTNITVQVVSPTQIVGSLAYTANYGDTSCSVTYPFSVNKS
ncbi:MAG: hypothetical protein LCI00_15865 [Chloroflexi bacterium]|nr:hypothetical protein [Chloroflexota bacterium]